MPWEIEFTPQAEAWYARLDGSAKGGMKAALDKLAEQGPLLGRPAVDSIKGSRHHNMKELRGFSGNQRALFVFDSQRKALILLGGDKTNNWKGWYRSNLPKADRLYDRHLRDAGKEGACRGTRAGARSTGRTR